MNFSIVHFNVSDDREFPSCVLILQNEIHQLDIATNPLGCVVTFTDSVGCTTEWFEDGKEWISEDRTSCPQPSEWEEDYWFKVTEALHIIDILRTKVL